MAARRAPKQSNGLDKSDQPAQITSNQHTAASPAMYSTFVSASALVAWSVASSAVILSNKHLMVEKGFPYPMVVTAGGQLASAVGGEQPVCRCGAACDLSTVTWPAM